MHTIEAIKYLVTKTVTGPISGTIAGRHRDSALDNLCITIHPPECFFRVQYVPVPMVCIFLGCHSCSAVAKVAYDSTE